MRSSRRRQTQLQLRRRSGSATSPTLLSVGDGKGTWQRFIIIATPQGPNNEGGPSSAPANGPTPRQPPAHQPVPDTASPGQPKECEAGNETYAAGQTLIGNPPAPSRRVPESDDADGRDPPPTPAAHRAPASG